MDRDISFTTHINEGYTCKGEYIVLGSAIFDGETIAGAMVKVHTRY
jgi:hypothetical protein